MLIVKKLFRVSKATASIMPYGSWAGFQEKMTVEKKLMDKLVKQYDKTAHKRGLTPSGVCNPNGVNHLLLSAFCFLPPAFCLLLSAFCFLPPASCLLPSAFCFLHSAFCLLPPAFCLLPSASCLLPPASCLLLAAY